MFFLYKEKKKLAVRLDSSTIDKDAECSLACIKLSFVLLAGSLLFVAAPQYWWADAAAAVFLAVFVAREGFETIRGDSCCGD
jgi:divalent metal cation (Fe/Co/Zn/Cd) transporter